MRNLLRSSGYNCFFTKDFLFKSIFNDYLIPEERTEQRRVRAMGLFVLHENNFAIAFNWLRS